jgi:hypothetical protein
MTHRFAAGAPRSRRSPSLAGSPVPGPAPSRSRLKCFITDAIDEPAMRFYQHFGFARLADDFPCRMALDLKPLIEA